MKFTPYEMSLVHRAARRINREAVVDEGRQGVYCRVTHEHSAVELALLALADAGWTVRPPSRSWSQRFWDLLARQ